MSRQIALIAETALGAALWIDAQERQTEEFADDCQYRMEHMFLGPAYSDDEIASRWFLLTMS